MLGTTPKEKEPAATSGKVKVAVVQAAPVAFNRERTLEKVHTLAGEAASKGARLALFPEAFVSAYPRGLDFGAVVGSRSEKGREDFRRYWESSVDVPGPAVDELARAARSNCIYLVVGVVERDRGRSTVPYCSSHRMAAFWASIERSCQPGPSAWCGDLVTVPQCRCLRLLWGSLAR